MKKREKLAVGLGLFPIDMLRYDECIPATEQDAEAITRSFFGPDIRLGIKKIRVKKLRPGRWDSARWKSFDWHLEDDFDTCPVHPDKSVGRIMELLKRPIEDEDILF